MTAPTTQQRTPIALFQRTGIELEYMIVDQQSLDVRPVADELIKAVCGGYESEIEPGGPDWPVSWSNELTLHVIELKTTRPAADVASLVEPFQHDVRRMNGVLRPLGARLLPTGMHPWMDPHAEMRLWPHEHNPIYEAYDRIFSCRGHGWANLQSVHVNLPFADDGEFGRLHAAVRLVLPLIPALAASSPVIDGDWGPIADHRLEVYRSNSARIPSVVGLVIPEPVFSRANYEREILEPIYRDLARHDPSGVLHGEWANSRGCIARFSRGSIEIRLIDAQECPGADLAVAALVTAAVRAHVEERWIPYEHQRTFATEPLHAVLLDTIRYAEHTRIHDPTFLRAYGIDRSLAWAGDLWKTIAQQVLDDASPLHQTVESILDGGTLSTRISRRLRRFPTRDELHAVYADLAGCLHEGALFDVREPAERGVTPHGASDDPALPAARDHIGPGS